jgi:DNA-binding MarR family transcriptional regulator
MGMTPNENHYRVLEVLYRCDKRKYDPTLAELSRLCGYKPPTVAFYVRKLIDEGLCRRERHRRKIELLPPAIEYLETVKESDEFVSGMIAQKSKNYIEKKVKQAEMREAIQNQKKKTEQECFDEAVRLGLSRNAVVSADVILDRGPLFRNRTFATKIG